MDKVRTSTQEQWIDEQGIVHCVMVEPEETLETARENITSIARLAGGARLPVLVDITDCKKIDLAARKYYAGPEPAVCQRAVALVTSSTVSRVLGNFFLGVNRPRFPVRLFDSQTKALDWLAHYLPKPTDAEAC